MALTRTQRRVLEEAVRKLERGPYDGWGQPKAIDQAALDEKDIHRWLESWIEEPLRLLLENDAGRVSARELEGDGI